MTSKKKKLFFCFLIISLCFYPMCGFCYEKDDKLRQRYNIIIVSMDSLRPDHLGCYGYSRMTSMNIDGLAKESVLFEEAIAQASWTLPSLVSFFTSQYVPTHQVDTSDRVLPSSAITLAEVLQVYGYRTAAFTGGFHLSSIFGVSQGFDTYFDRVEFGRLSDILPRTRKWLKSRYSNIDNADLFHSPFFLFLQAYDAHAPYKLPGKYKHLYDSNYKGIIDRFIMDHNLGDMIEGYTLKDKKNRKTYQLGQRDIEHIIAHYDAAITYADKQLGDFFSELKRLKLWDDCMVIFMDNHGEPFLEHGHILVRKHGGTYEEGIRVPLIIKFPKKQQAEWLIKQKVKLQGMRIKTQAQLIDIMPTILDDLNIPIHHVCQGRSLIPLITVKAPPGFNEYVFSSGASGHEGQFQATIRTNKWKLLQFGNDSSAAIRYELYNLVLDPHEQKNCYSKEPGISLQLKGRLTQWLKEVSVGSTPLARDERLLGYMLKRMRKFGYWWLTDPVKSTISSRDERSEDK